MNEFINKHVIKVQLGVLVGCIVTVLYYSRIASGYLDKIDQNSKNAEKFQATVEDVVALKAVLPTMQDDIATIKEDIKDLLKNKK